MDYLCVYNEFMISRICKSKLLSDMCMFQMLKERVQAQAFILPSSYKDLSCEAVSEMRLSIHRNYTLHIFFHYEDYVWKTVLFLWRVFCL